VNKERLHALLEAYLSNSISDEDCRELLSYSKGIGRYGDETDDVIDKQLLNFQDEPVLSTERTELILALIKNDPRFFRGKSANLSAAAKFISMSWVRIAAVLLVVLFVALYLNRSSTDVPQQVNINQQMDTVIAPGGTKAMLTLADGTKIELTEAKIGELANDGTVSIRKTANGQLTYDLSNLADDNSGMIKYNTIETPRGGEYHVILPDGTSVWLNSASSLKFPTRFSGTTREVTLVGEAYFEVFHNDKLPFHVHVKDTKVGVLGTHFNVSAYEDDDGVTTTLLEGSVSVSKDKKEFVLKPGQQSVTAGNAGRIVVKSADIEQVMAWRNGYFRFNDEEIGSILKKVSRWYDVDIEYRTVKQGQRLGGISSRSKSLNDLMDQLEKIGNLHFKIEGRRIIVLD